MQYIFKKAYQYTLPVKVSSNTKKAYIATELKSLIVALIMEKFHHFLHGKKFQLETDQKPLIIVLAKSLILATQRLITLPCDFNVRHIKGTTYQLAYCL